MTLRVLPVLDMAPQAPTPARQPPGVDAAIAEFVTDDVVLPRFHIWTLGCQMNRSDAEEMAGQLLAAGCSEVPDAAAADLLVINTCSIRETAEQKVIGRMGALARLKAANPLMRVVLTGCSVRAGEEARLRRRYPAVDLFLRPDEEPELATRLGLAGPTARGTLGEATAGEGAGADPPTPGAPEAGQAPPTVVRLGRELATADALPARRDAAVRDGRVARESRTHAWLPIIYGCDKTCTYCIVPFSRGPERSRPFDDVVAEAALLARGGYQEVTLLGQNVNSYGHDLPPEPRFAAVRGGRDLGRRLALDGRPDIAALLRAIDGLRTADGVPAIPRLRFITSHPWDLSERLVAAMAECPSVCEHLHLPIQSGDDAVLRRMGRQYTTDAYLGLVERLRAAIPGICLTTDVIVGFCGETDAAFEATLALLEAVRFDAVFAAAYSPRPGTPAARLSDDVPGDVKRRRLNALLADQETISLERNRAWVGQEVEVLVSEVGPRRGRAHGHDGVAGGDESGATGATGTATQASGRTRENKLVHVPGDASLVGRRVIVRIEHAGPYALVGRLVG
jgi:tRNA-2-methylthio-N6-dimethylallyladenosine synthase